MAIGISIVAIVICASVHVATCLFNAFLADDIPYLLFANRRFIQRTNLDGSELQTLRNVTGTSAVGLDYDYRQVRFTYIAVPEQTNQCK